VRESLIGEMDFANGGVMMSQKAQHRLEMQAVLKVYCRPLHLITICMRDATGIL